MQRILRHARREDGFVSLFSTIFFMLLVTVITIGFIQITATEQQQALNNDLSASALASAQSGIEDGKRAVLKYHSLTNPTDISTYRTQMTAPNSSNCTSITGSQVGADLGISSSGNVVGNSQINQSYTCLTVNLNSPDFLSQSSASKSQIVPLRAVSGDFQQIRVSWHLLSTSVGQDGDGLPGATPGTSPYYAAGPLLYPANGSTTLPIGWGELGYPAYLRVQLFGKPNSAAYDRNALNQRSRSVLLIPARSGVAPTTPIDLGTADPNPATIGTAELNPQTIRCEADPTENIGSYACSALLQLPAGGAFASNNNDYFLRITPIYGATHFRVALVSGGNEVNFNQVQPIVDVTGRAADVYRRLQARVQANQISKYPEFAAEIANDICKTMQVSSNPSDYIASACD